MNIQQEIYQITSIIKIIINSLALIYLRQASTTIQQKINFTGKLEDDDGTTKFFITEKQQKNYSKLLFRFIKRNRII